jgi:lysophospholipase L1-like esterase
LPGLLISALSYLTSDFVHPVKILCLGDSLTDGTVGVGFIPFLEELLPGNQYVNLGANGDTIAGLRRRAERLQQRGDAAIVWVGTNDVMMCPDWVDNSSAAEKDYRLLLRAVAARARVVFAVSPLIAGPSTRRCSSIRSVEQPRWSGGCPKKPAAGTWTSSHPSPGGRTASSPSTAHT